MLESNLFPDTKLSIAEWNNSLRAADLLGDDLNIEKQKHAL